MSDKLHRQRKQAEIWLIMKFRCWLFIYAKCCFGFCLSNSGAAVTRKWGLEWRNNGKLKNYICIGICKQIIQNNILSSNKGEYNVCLFGCVKLQGASKPSSSCLSQQPHRTPKCLGRERSIFCILFLPKFYFLQKQGKWKPRLLNCLVLLRAPLFVNFQVEMEIVFISLIFICNFHAPNLCVSWSKVTARSSSQFKSDILCYVQHIAGLEN